MQNLNRCMDNYTTSFDSFSAMLNYHREESEQSKWVQCPVNQISVEPLDKVAEPRWNIDLFADGTSALAVEDTVLNAGLALRVNQELRLLRDTAYRGLLDRAKISGSALAKLRKQDLADVLNRCLQLHRKQQALLLIRDEKISAVHSGDEKDYSILPIDELLETLQENLDTRFMGNEFEKGYTSHALTGATWKLPRQTEHLLEKYSKHLETIGKKQLAHKLVPGIQFSTSDTGVASAKVSALLLGLSDCPIHIGSCVAVDHRSKKTVDNFKQALDMLFAQYGDNIKKMEKLLDITLLYPVNAMTRVCKELVMPKKEATEAINRFQLINGTDIATAHDVFIAMQEIPYLLKINGTPETKILAVQENMARALNLNWSEFDLARAVSY